MNGKYTHMFEPITVQRMQVKNRIAMMPMGTNFAGKEGSISQKHIDYYESRAKGGVGLIIVENACVDFPSGANGTTQLRIDEDSNIPGLAELCERVHAYGACIAVQINHAGAAAMASRIGMQPVSASDLPVKKGGDIPRPLTEEEIQEISRKYGRAAKRAQMAGFDAVEIQVGHNYLLSQFLSPLTNNRKDAFGGSPENRARFAGMVLKEIRSQVGPFFPISLRISADEFLEGGNTLEDTMTYLPYLEEYVDIFNVSSGLSESEQYQVDVSSLPDGWRAYLSRAVKQKFQKPCIVTGNIRDPQVAERILADGDADFIGMGRGLLAEPEWVNKVKDGKEEELRKCISCNIGCTGNRRGTNRPIHCTVNPDVVYGDRYKEQKVTSPCNVVVVGGGTSGLEAACTAAEVGCNVFLMEEKEELGGMASVIARIPGKVRLNDFPEYLIRRAERLKNLYVFTGHRAAPEELHRFHPDLIVNAAGGHPLLPKIPGLREHVDQEGGRVKSILKMIEEVEKYPHNMEGKKVVIVGGGAVGLDVAEFFAVRNARVTIIEMMSAIGNGLDPVSKTFAFSILSKYQAEVRTNTALLEVKEGCFVVKNADGNQEELFFDQGFLCMGIQADVTSWNALRAEFEGQCEMMNIGDSKRARRIIEGTEEGRNILITLKQMGYL